jgi:hypothetical protein
VASLLLAQIINDLAVIQALLRNRSASKKMSFS